MGYYRCEHFTISELVDKATLLALGEGKCWKLFPEKFLICLDRLRSALGRSITINNWHTGGQYQWRGYRSSNCKIGAEKSMHRYGKGVDFDVKGMTSAQVRSYLKSNAEMYPEITRCENDVSWVHVDCKDRSGWSGIKFFNP